MKNEGKIWSISLALIIVVLSLLILFRTCVNLVYHKDISSEGKAIPKTDDIISISPPDSVSTKPITDDKSSLNTPLSENKAEDKSEPNSPNEEDAAIMFEMEIEEKVDQEVRIKQLEYEKKIEKLKNKPFAFGIEDDLYLEKKYECFAYIGNNKSLDSLLVGFENVSKDIKIVLQDSIRVDYEMSIKLKGKNFKIEPITEEKQLVIDTKDYTEWKWYITPSESGYQVLHIYVYAHIYVNAGDAPYELEVYSQPVYVNVGFLNGVNIFLKENWEWIATALVPLIYFGYKNRSRIASTRLVAQNNVNKFFKSTSKIIIDRIKNSIEAINNMFPK